MLKSRTPSSPTLAMLVTTGSCSGVVLKGLGNLVYTTAVDKRNKRLDQARLSLVPVRNAQGGITLDRHTIVTKGDRHEGRTTENSPRGKSRIMPTQECNVVLAAIVNQVLLRGGAVAVVGVLRQ